MSYHNLLRLCIGLTIAVAIGAALLVTVRARRTATNGTNLGALAAVRRQSLAWRLAGLVVGLAAGVALASGPTDWLGLGPGLAGPAFALCLLGGVVIGEVTARPPRGTTRTVTLEVRAARQFLPRGMTRLVAGFGLALVALLSATSAVASPDDLGRSGRFLAFQCGDHGSGGGPWPGSYYTVPIGLTILIGLTVAVLATRAVVRRPRPLADDLGRQADDRLRRASARAIVAASGVLITVPLAGSALVAGAVLTNLSCAPSVAPILGAACFVLGTVSALAACAFAAEIIFPAPIPAIGAATASATAGRAR